MFQAFTPCCEIPLMIPPDTHSEGLNISTTERLEGTEILQVDLDHIGHESWAVHQRRLGVGSRC
jgi:hypothetical protein